MRPTLILILILCLLLASCANNAPVDYARIARQNAADLRHWDDMEARGEMTHGEHVALLQGGMSGAWIDGYGTP